MIIRFPIGDWSDDGHGKCDWFDVSTDKTLKDVRDAHFALEARGIDIGTFCSEYEQYSLSDEQKKACEDFGITFPNNDKYDSNDPDSLWDETYEGTEGLVQLWIDLLNLENPLLNCKLVEQGPCILWGSDGDDRYMNAPGYGRFS